MKLPSYVRRFALMCAVPLTKPCLLGVVVAQVSNLLYRRFPIGRTFSLPLRWIDRRIRRLEALRYSRLETCATTLSTGLLVCAAGLLLSGCFLKPVTVSTRRFILAPIPASELLSPLPHRGRGQGEGASIPQQLSVGVGFVKMPAYLLRNSIVVRKGANEIEYLEDASWGERVDQSFQQTLAANLSILLPSGRVYLSAWERDQVKVRVFVNVEQFDVDTQGRGTLIASWRITAPGSEKPLKSGQARLARPGPAPHGNPQVIVTTLSALTAEFSRELAQAIHQSAELTPL